MATLWLVLLIISLITAAFSVAAVALWFAAGAGAAWLAAALGAPIWAQAALFTALAALSLITLIPLIRQQSEPKTGSDFDAFIGARGKVIQQINNTAGTGMIQLSSSQRIARSTTGIIIPEGATVVVDRVEGVRVFVLPENR